MHKRRYIAAAVLVGGILSLLACAPQQGEKDIAGSNSYDDLVTLFKDFREFRLPNLVDGVPDYSPEAMAVQAEELKTYQKRLAAIDVSGWPVARQIDYHIVQAEMNGLAFDHRVLKPWSRDPVFYLKSQRGAGPAVYLPLNVPELPMSDEDKAAVRAQLRAVPKMYEQAEANLTGASADLASIALHFLDSEIAIYHNLAGRLAEHHPDLVPDAERAQEAVKDYGRWLEQNRETMTAPAGLGKENYDWWLKNVQLVPYTWDELVVLMEKEYDRAIATLKLEQHRNRRLPKLEPVPDEAGYRQRYYDFQKYLLKFLDDEDVFTIPDYLKPLPPKAWVDFEGRQGGSVRDFFEQCEDRNPLPSPLIHEFLGHNFDGLRRRRDPRPIRGANRIYAMDMIRSEGVAFALEGIFRDLGIYDSYPRGREINSIMTAFRAVRALADLRLHSNEFDLDDAFAFCYDKTPYHWMLPDGFEVWYEMETTLRFPGWHMGMVLGKIQLMSLMADRGSQLGDDFDLHDFLDEFFASGMIPLALTRWEMTGLTDEVATLW